MSDPNTNGQKCAVDADCPESFPACGSNMTCEKSFLGPSFNYVSHIRSPQDMQLAVSGNMWQFGNDVAAIGDYIALLIAGPSRANKLTIDGQGINQRPMGNSFMMELEQPVQMSKQIYQVHWFLDLYLLIIYL